MEGTVVWTLSGFADEIDPELDVQLRTLAETSISHVELRGVWGKAVLALSDDELARVKSALDENDVKVSAVGSPIGKIGIEEVFAPHVEKFQRAMDIAELLGAPYVRIFSFFIPEGEEPGRYRGAVLERMERLVQLAEERGVTLAHENERHIYGETPERCHDLLATIDSPRLRAVWDPANFVIGGVQPHDEGYALLRPYLAYVHVKDAVASSGEVVPAGEGDGQWRETLTALRADGFDGFFSLEPHLAKAGQFGGFSGIEEFRRAADAFKGLLDELRIAWT
jgi:sugar phosphate isomerase/epimerase